MVLYAYMCVFVHSRFVENPLIWSWEINPSFLIWFCHSWFGIKEKLAPQYMGPYPILEKFGSLAYQVELHSSLAGVHNVFHVSQLKKCLKPPTGVVVEDTILLEPNLTYKAYLIKVLEQQD
jgi:hypothetical protein